MHEYEFRLVVQSPLPFLTVMHDILEAWGQNTLQEQHVWYAKPHFRYRNKFLEIKSIVSTEAVYYDGLWFRWIYSLEIPYKQWSRSHHSKFLDMVGNYQCPFQKETRLYLKLDSQAQVYTFQDLDGHYRLVFEWEQGTFLKPLEKSPTSSLLNALDPYDKVLEHFRTFSPPSYELNEFMIRKPVTCVENLDVLKDDEFLIAHKLDGIFGLVFSYANYIKEKWEGYVKKRHNGITLGDGIVFAAEKMPDNTVVLLDVYQVRGVPTAKWCRQNILVNYFSLLHLPEGYQVQKYCYSVMQLTNCPYPTDGYICHNMRTDEIFKVKTNHSLDVVYMDGFFWLPSKDKPGLCKRFKSLENNTFLKEGHVYEVSNRSGRVIRERTDRFTGNTWQQIENILAKQPWQGPSMQEVIKVKRMNSRRKTRA